MKTQKTEQKIWSVKKNRDENLLNPEEEQQQQPKKKFVMQQLGEEEELFWG